MSEDQQNDENLGSFYVGRTRVPPQPKRVLPRGMLTAVAVLAFAGLIWYAYPQGQEKYTDVDVPVITADTTPYKAKPADPGGMDVPHRDSTVFESLDKKSAPARAEKVTSKQEEPLDRKKLGLDTSKPKMNLDAQSPPLPAANKEAAVYPPVPPKQSAPTTKTAQSVKRETKSLEALKPAAGEAAPSAAYVQLGAYKTEAEALSEGTRLHKKYPQLQSLTMRAQKADLGAKGVYYRLQAGAPSADKAKSVCAALKSAGASCMVVK
jgi:hypothetical protein